MGSQGAAWSFLTYLIVSGLVHWDSLLCNRSRDSCCTYDQTLFFTITAVRNCRVVVKQQIMCFGRRKCLANPCLLPTDQDGMAQDCNFLSVSVQKKSLWASTFLDFARIISVLVAIPQTFGASQSECWLNGVDIFFFASINMLEKFKYHQIPAYLELYH